METMITKRDRMIVAELSKSYTCRICNEILIHAMVANCGHRFCRYCITLCLHNCLKCPECSELLQSTKADEDTDRKIETSFGQCSPYLIQKRKSIIENRSFSEKEMTSRFNIDTSFQFQDSKNLNNATNRRQNGNDHYKKISRNSKILESKLFKTYDRLLNQISSDNISANSQPSGPKGDHNCCTDEDQAKIEHVAKMAAKTASEAFQNLSQADDLLKEADGVLGIIEFLKTYSMDSIAKEAESFKIDSRTNFEEQIASEVSKGYENIQQILNSNSSNKARAKSKIKNTSEASNTLSSQKLANDKEYFNMNSAEFSTHMKKCQEALQRIRNESIGNFVSGVSKSTLPVASKSKNPPNSEVISRTSKWRETKPNIVFKRTNSKSGALSGTIKKASKASIKESSDWKLPPLFSNEN